LLQVWPKDAGIAAETAQQRLRDGYQDQIKAHMKEQGVRGDLACGVWIY
jgi:hypothetical protein